jgi:23S rRNA (uracil1939-C5)-methyltransferase
MTFEFTPSKLVYGGDALGHYQGRTVLVPGALPGERVEAEEVRSAKGVLRARTLRVLTPARERVAPPCPYFGRCGGCQYQHLGYEHQREWKREILRETLRRIGKIAWNGEIPVHSAEPWNYRNQAQLKVSRGPGGAIELGFFEAESHRLVPVDTCLILSPRLNEVLAGLRCAEWLGLAGGCREIELLSDDRDEKVMVTFRGDFTPENSAALAQMCLENLPGVTSVTFKSERKSLTEGAPVITIRAGEFEYRVSPGSFFQASRFLIGNLVEAATREVSGKLALDLYAGVGLFTLPLAQNFEQVVGVEGNEGAAADLAANARQHGFKNVRAVAESAYDFLRRFAQAGPDLVLLDPPRAGVGGPSLQLLGRHRPARIHYVSCHPPTLARDLASLSELGYCVNSIEMFDFFPQTAHIECLAKLTRSNPAGS